MGVVEAFVRPRGPPGFVFGELRGACFLHPGQGTCTWTRKVCSNGHLCLYFNRELAGSLSRRAPLTQAPSFQVLWCGCSSPLRPHKPPSGEGDLPRLPAMTCDLSQGESGCLLDGTRSCSCFSPSAVGLPFSPESTPPVKIAGDLPSRPGAAAFHTSLSLAPCPVFILQMDQPGLPQPQGEAGQQGRGIWDGWKRAFHLAGRWAGGAPGPG